MQATMREFDLEAQLRIKGDAVAAMGMVKRQGLGRVRHLAVADLWIQQKAKDGSAIYEKLPGTDNTSDIMTKPVEADVLEKHMRALGFEYRGGRHELTPTYNGLEDGTPTSKEEEASANAGDQCRKVGPQRTNPVLPQTQQRCSQTTGRLCSVFRSVQPSTNQQPTTPTNYTDTCKDTDQQLAALCGNSGHIGCDRCKRPGSKNKFTNGASNPGRVKAQSARS